MATLGMGTAYHINNTQATYTPMALHLRVLQFTLLVCKPDLSDSSPLHEERS